MKSELRCEEARVELSARLDGEIDPSTSAALDEHLQGCEDCRNHERRLARVRQMARVQASVAVPDLVEPIMERIRERPQRNVLRWPQLRTAGIAAAAAALILLGASLPWTEQPPDSARASEIVRSVRSAARSLSSYHARFAITERGWHSDVSERRFEAEVWFQAPEKFRLEVRDLTTYPPGNWPHNDVELVAGPRRYRISEPSACPTAALPSCDRTAPTEDRTVVERQPFDGSSRLPTDIAVPLETLSSANGLEVLGSARYLGSDAQRVVLPYRQAVPLVEALEAGGSWRSFHPLDEVEIWIDTNTWFPLRFTVRAGDSPDRELWANRLGFPTDKADEVLLDARATMFGEPGSFKPSLFQSRVTGAVQDGGFIPITLDEVAEEAPAFTAGLRPYRAGVTPFGQTIITYERGMNYLKISDDPRVRTALAYAGPAAVVSLSQGRALYQPATETSGRLITLFGENGRITVETNLPREQLLAVASSLGIRGRLPSEITTKGHDVRRIDASEIAGLPFGSLPGWVPDGFDRTAALLTRSASGRTLTIYYQRAESSFGGLGIRIVQTPSIDRLPPSGEETVNIRLGSTTARWSFERSELEWIEDGVYRAIATSDGDLASAVHIARSLR